MSIRAFQGGLADSHEEPPPRPSLSKVHVTLDPNCVPKRNLEAPVEHCGSGEQEPSRAKSKDSKASKDSRRSHDSSVGALSRTSSAVKLVITKVDPLTCTVMAAGALLASCAGMTNAVAFLALETFVSHVTGTLSRVGLHAGANSMAEAGTSLLLVLSFALGAAVCGCMISRGTVSFGYALYGLALLGNASLLVIAVLAAESDVAPYLLAAACGLQNGMATSYSGAVIRTTHVTGICTDVGLIIGRLVAANVKFYCRSDDCQLADDERTGDCRKLLLLVILGVSFCLGVFVGTLLHNPMGVYTLLLPAGLTGTAGMSYTAYRSCCLHQPLFSSREPRSPKVDALGPPTSVWTSRGRSLEDGDARQEAKASLKDSEPLRLEDVVSPTNGSADKGQSYPDPFAPPPPGTPRAPGERLPLSRVLAILDSLESSLAVLPHSSVPGMPDLQAEALEAHRRLRSVLNEVNSSADAGPSHI